jgi:hypothetical protein
MCLSKHHRDGVFPKFLISSCCTLSPCVLIAILSERVYFKSTVERERLYAKYAPINVIIKVMMDPTNNDFILLFSFMHFSSCSAKPAVHFLSS